MRSPQPARPRRMPRGTPTFLLHALLVAGCAPPPDRPQAPGASAQALLANVDGVYATGERPEIGVATMSGLSCTATLVGRQAIVLAAHCDNRQFLNRPALGSFGTWMANGTGPPIVIDRYWNVNDVHLNPPTGASDMDVMLAHLQVPVTPAVRPASISAFEPSNGTRVSVYGFGCGTGRDNPDLRDFGTKRVYSYLHPGSNVTCPGDSGGPRVFGDLNDPDGAIFAVNSGYSYGGDINASIVSRRADLLNEMELWARMDVLHRPRMALGGHHSTIVMNSSDSVYTFGGNDKGQLGVGDRSDRAYLASLPLKDIKAMTAGRAHTCAITFDGYIYCWGSNGKGQLGIASNVPDATLPTPIDLSRDWVSVAAGYEHTCALDKAGQVYCWGSNEYRQLGAGGTGNVNSPVRATVVGAKVTAIAAGGEHTCVIIETGQQIGCWGRNDQGQLGDGTVSATPPTTVRWKSYVPAVPSSAFRRVVAGPRHSCAIADDGKLLCWGANDHGQLGGGAAGAPDPVGVVASLPGGAFDVALGHGHTCALTPSGGLNRQALCWGQNDQGQAGAGGADLLAPTVVSGGNRVPGGVLLGIGAGDKHTCIWSVLSNYDLAYGEYLDNNNAQFLCFGFNGAGQTLQGAASCPSDDGNPCTADSCDPGLGPQHSNLPDLQSCGDTECQTGRVCQAGVCQGTARPDGTACSAGACYSGACTGCSTTDLEVEPNSSMATANYYQAPRLRGSINPGSDSDMVFFYVDSGNRVGTTIELQPCPFNARLALYSYSGQLVTSTNGCKLGPLTAAAGWQYARVSASIGWAFDYDLVIRPGGYDEREPNQIPSWASAFNRSFFGAIRRPPYAAVDPDMVKIFVPSGTTSLVVETMNPGTGTNCGNTLITVFGSDGTTVLGSNDDFSYPWSRVELSGNVPTGMLYVKVDESPWSFCTWNTGKFDYKLMVTRNGQPLTCGLQ